MYLELNQWLQLHHKIIYLPACKLVFYFMNHDGICAVFWERFLALGPAEGASFFLVVEMELVMVQSELKL